MHSDAWYNWPPLCKEGLEPWKTAVNPPACKREQENMLLAIEESLITKYNLKGIDYSLRARHYGK